MPNIMVIGCGYESKNFVAGNGRVKMLKRWVEYFSRSK